MFEAASPWQIVFRSSDGRACHAVGLALRAAGIDCTITSDRGESVIVVATADASAALAEIEAFALDNAEPPAEVSVHRVSIESTGRGRIGVAGYAAAIIAIAVFEHFDLFSDHWLRAGKTHAEAIRAGEWWRAFTALTLHSDGIHLASNLLFGGLFGYFAGQMLGSGLAWLSILVAGGAGNLLNGLIREPQHTSIGASTAVFAALGIVAALSWSRRLSTNRPWLLQMAPLIGAAVLLSFLGTGGERTDVMAHITGFLSGAIFGGLEGRFNGELRLSRAFQCLLGLVAIALLAAAWALALRSVRIAG